MKKLLTCLLAVAMLGSMLALDIFAKELPEGATIVDVPFGTPVVDGEMDALYAKSGVMESIFQNGMNDLKAANQQNYTEQELAEFFDTRVEARFAYDDKYFYVYCQVFDDTFDRDKGLPTHADAKNPTDNPDNLEFYFYFYDMLNTDWTKSTDASDRGSGRIRFHSPTVCPDYENREFKNKHAENKIGVAIDNGELEYQIARQVTYDANQNPTGMIIEYAVEVTETCKQYLTAGTIIGFGFKYGDEITGNSKADASYYSGWLGGASKPRVDPIQLLAKETAPETTKAPETTAAPETTKLPETTAAPMTTKARESTPNTADASTVLAGMCGMAMLVVCTVVCRKNKAD